MSLCEIFKQLDAKILSKNFLLAAKRENVHKRTTYMCQWRLPISLHVAKSLDPDPTRQNVGPDLDQNCLKP